MASQTGDYWWIDPIHAFCAMINVDCPKEYAFRSRMRHITQDPEDIESIVFAHLDVVDQASLSFELVDDREGGNRNIRTDRVVAIPRYVALSSL